MGRLELNSGDVPIEQKSPVDLDAGAYDGDVVIGEKIGNAEYLDELAFMEEPVVIRIEPSNERNAPRVFPVWNNGKKAEVFQNGRWDEIGWLPVATVLTVKRKIVEQIIRAKVDTIHVETLYAESERPQNVARAESSPVHSCSIIEDKNPRGPAWATEMRRRNF